jgi:hypothetical protein
MGAHTRVSESVNVFCKVEKVFEMLLLFVCVLVFGVGGVEKVFEMLLLFVCVLVFGVGGVEKVFEMLL